MSPNDVGVSREDIIDHNGNKVSIRTLYVFGTPVAVFNIYDVRSSARCLYPTYIWVTEGKDYVSGDTKYILGLLKSAYEGIVEDLTF